MDIGRPISIERISERLPSEDSRADSKPRKKTASSGRSNGDSIAARSGTAGVFLTPINFEYLPSGKIQLNREAREQIIDFFE